MSFTTDLTTDIGKVRLYIHDLDVNNPIFPDDTMIQAFIDAEGTLKMAAAFALETIAGNQVLLLKCIQLLDLKTDGYKTAQGFLAVAQRMRDTADDDGWSGLEIAQFADTTVFNYREYLMKRFIEEDLS